MVATIATLCLSGIVKGHPGGLDSQGGHNDRKSGGYHFHTGGPSEDPPAPLARQSAPSARMAPRLSFRTQARTTYTPSDRRSALVNLYVPIETPEQRKKAREAIAKEMLEKAKRLQQQKKLPDAIASLKGIKQFYSDCEPAAEAAELLGKLDGQQSEDAAERKFKLAKSLLDSGKTDSAVKWFKEIIRDWPQSRAAKESRQILIKMDIRVTL